MGVLGGCVLVVAELQDIGVNGLGFRNLRLSSLNVSMVKSFEMVIYEHCKTITKAVSLQHPKVLIATQKQLYMKQMLMGSLMLLATASAKAQALSQMQWFNEPEVWKAKGNSLSMNVTPHTDYWRISHYGFTVDDAPFLYTLRGGEFEVKVKIAADYQTRFDQSGLMLRIDYENYIKAGIEYVDGKYNLSTVVTHHTSDWSIIPLEKPVPYVWLKAVRRLDAVEVFYSFDDKELHPHA